MDRHKILVEKTKKSFVIYSLLGVCLVAVLSYLALNLHVKNFKRQSALHDLNGLVSKQMIFVHKISSLGERLDNYNSEESIEAGKKLSSELRKLKSMNLEINEFIKDKKLPIFVEVNKIYASLDAKSKMKNFMIKANELIKNKDLNYKDIKNHINFLTSSSEEGIGEVLGVIKNRLKVEQTKSLNFLNQMGFILVGLSILQIVVVWLFVFKPLYQTVLTQNEEISDSMLRIESANRSKTDFLANISHEIRTPMTALIGYVELLKKDNLDKDEKMDAVNIIDTNASHLIELIDEILDISKIEAGKFDFEREEVDLSTFLNEVYSLINVKSEDKGIDLIFRNSGEIPEKIFVDPKRLKQILFNMLGNAIKFTSKGYVQLTVSFLKDTNQLQMIVKDTGIGIGPKQQKNLFKPFEQADNSMSRKFGGTGLGLVLSKGLAKKMGGDITIVDSVEGKGTTFEVLLDVGKAEELDFVSKFSTNIEDDVQDTDDSPSLDGVKVLVVDDAKENARLFKIYLKNVGADVEVANDGFSALGLAQKKFFDVILLDLQMPGMDGFETIKKLRENLFEGPIAALTAHATKEEKLKTKNAGFDDHIAKPVKSNELVSSITKLINRA